MVEGLLLNADPLRLFVAGGMLLAYAALCLTICLAQGRKRRVAPTTDKAAWIVAYASQTGFAECLAEQTTEVLRLAGVSARLCELSAVSAENLAHTKQILFIASTYGEGDPPDNAALFASRLIGARRALPNLHYAVLALGDSSYANFCGFGRALEQWLQSCGAQALFARIDVDRGDAQAIELWRQRLGHLAGISDLPGWESSEATGLGASSAFDDWQLTERRLLNAGSAGEPVFHLALAPVDAALPDWQAGDLVQLLVPGDAHPREYSIASLPDDGRVHLLIRLRKRPDGSSGAASGWLALHAALGDRLSMRVRAHRRFRLEENQRRPLILIGNGTGIAGLRSHLKARAKHGEGPNWLLFGERNAAHDFHYREEIEQWQASGVLQHAHIVFSRDQEVVRYVQDCLAESGDLLRQWVGQGAAIYVCGSLRGMASGVDAALAGLLGRDALDALSLAGRYRRDVY
jgi:sulfite reductase (NADPH) flavoprotein alpha-component